MSFEWIHSVEGQIALGHVPDAMMSCLDQLMGLVKSNEKQYNEMIDRPDLMTSHVWIDDTAPETQKAVRCISDDVFWQRHLKHADTDTIIPVTEMNELYFSRPPVSTSEGVYGRRLYGANGNFQFHRDAPLLSFVGCRLYRVIIGVSESNGHTTTCFPNCHQCIQIGKGDYAVFDFSRTTHHVTTTAFTASQNIRTLLKLHFLCLDQYAEQIPLYRSLVYNTFNFYEKTTRYVMATGTNPHTFYQYVMGMVSQCGFEYSYHTVVIALFLIWLTFRSYRLKIHPLWYVICCIFGCIAFFFGYLMFCMWDDRQEDRQRKHIATSEEKRTPHSQ